MSKKRRGYCRHSAYKRIARRDGAQCRACAAVPLRWASYANHTTAEGFPYSAVESAIALDLDHVRPIADGGLSTDDNFQLLCRPCHQAKTRAENSMRRRSV